LGASYFLLVVDDYSRYMWVKMLKTKDQALECFKRIKLRAELECDSKLKVVRIDMGESSFPICS
jgi:histone deacetylase 1/2